jgi:hypothetical protein
MREEHSRSRASHGSAVMPGFAAENAALAARRDAAHTSNERGPLRRDLYPPRVAFSALISEPAHPDAQPCDAPAAPRDAPALKRFPPPPDRPHHLRPPTAPPTRAPAPYIRASISTVAIASPTTAPAAPPTRGGGRAAAARRVPPRPAGLSPASARSPAAAIAGAGTSIPRSPAAPCSARSNADRKAIDSAIRSAARRTSAQGRHGGCDRKGRSAPGSMSAGGGRGREGRLPPGVPPAAAAEVAAPARRMALTAISRPRHAPGAGGGEKAPPGA